VKGALLKGLPSSFSGQDFQVWAYYDAPGERDKRLPSWLQDGSVALSSLHTITSSFASSASPVVSIGRSSPKAHTTGQKTFAGSLIFTFLGIDPLEELMLQRKSADARGGLFSVDQIPPFNIVIWGQNEYATLKNKTSAVSQSVFKILTGVKLVTHGESITIDDFYLEQSYQYRCSHVTPWTVGDLTVAKLVTPGKSAPSPAPVNSLRTLLPAFSYYERAKAMLRNPGAYESADVLKALGIYVIPADTSISTEIARPPVAYKLSNDTETRSF